ncbi:hypothetical protein [Ureaplasma canigenitalium]|uniref:hypothetical protein n=1 Tax=Ureaplasma canigenitalium TaxID=42092 RepID=UPI00068EAE2B|nr:hypothetical protein [Ureaplasma canigenitalium]
MMRENIKLYFKTFHKSPSTSIFNLTLSGVFIAIFIIARAITKYFDFLNGYSWQLQMAVFSLALIFIPNFYYKLMFFIITPFVVLIFGFSSEIFFGYILPHYAFFPLLFLDLIFYVSLFKRDFRQKIKIIIMVIMTIALSFFSYIGVHLSYSIQGVLYYKVVWSFSLAFNALVSYISFILNSVVIAFVLPGLFFLRKKYLYYYQLNY